MKAPENLELVELKPNNFKDVAKRTGRTIQFYRTMYNDAYRDNRVVYITFNKVDK